MQIDAVRIQNTTPNIATNGKTTLRQVAAPSFKGNGTGSPLDFFVTFFETMSHGGLALSFLFQDFAACGVPRTYLSLVRNKEELGHLNTVAAGETCARELFTGSSMFIIPFLILSAASKMTGSATKVTVKTISDFSDLMKEVEMSGKYTAEENEEVKRLFYKKVYERIAQNGEIRPETVDDFARNTLDAEKTKWTGLAGLFAKKDKNNPQSKSAKREKIATDFSLEKKLLSDDFKTEFTSATISAKSADGNKKNLVNIDRLLKNLEDYSHDYLKYRTDYLKNNPEICQEIVEKFKINRSGARFLANILLTVGVGCFVAILPKLYSRSKTNPEAVIENKNCDTFKKGGE